MKENAISALRRALPRLEAAEEHLEAHSAEIAPGTYPSMREAMSYIHEVRRCVENALAELL